MQSYDFYITDEEYAIAESNGISYGTLNKRIRLFGWEKQRAMTQPPQKRLQFTELRKQANANGIASTTFYARIKWGWSPEDAAKIPPNKEPIKIAHEVRRVVPKHFYELAEKNGISYKTFQSRIYNSKWDYERAATEPIWTKEQICKAGKERYIEIHGRR